jgi:hypothetical protein
VTDDQPSAPGPFTEDEIQRRRRSLTDDENRDLAYLTRQRMDDLQVLHKNTGNPVYAWQAVNLVRVLNREHKRLREPRMDLPDWVVSYLSITARRICDLADGLDYREAPEPFGTWPVDPQEPWDKVAERVCARRKTLSAGDAMKLALSALGLQRQTVNNFAKYQELRQAEMTDLFVEVFSSYPSGESLTKEKAKELFLDNEADRADRLRESGVTPNRKDLITDERSIHRRISRARKAGKP